MTVASTIARVSFRVAIRATSIASGIWLDNPISSSACRADEPATTKQSPHADAAATLAPFVDNQTLLVAHVDLNAFEALKTIDWITGVLGFSERSRDHIQSQAAPISVVTQGLPKSQSVSVYIAISLSDITSFARLPPRFAGESKKMRLPEAGTRLGYVLCTIVAMRRTFS